MFQPHYHDPKTQAVKRSQNWSFRHHVNGTACQLATGTTNYNTAARIARQHLQRHAGRQLAASFERTTFGDLTAPILQDYKINGRKSLDRVPGAVKHLTETFEASRLARDLTVPAITTYVETRQTAGAASATINQELACLRRMFRLGERAGLVASRPYIGLLHVDNTRKGFSTRAQLDAVLAHLPAPLRTPIHTAYITGWRIKDVLLSRQQHHVDLAAGWLRLDPGETKIGEGRMFPLTPDLHSLLEGQLAETRALEWETGRIIPWLFHRDGAQIKSFRRAWGSATKAAGVPWLIPHDFRRTAVRNLERAGVPRSAAMKLVGHKTESIYRRYAIADEGMLLAGGDKLAALHLLEQQQARDDQADIVADLTAHRGKFEESQRRLGQTGKTRRGR